MLDAARAPRGVRLYAIGDIHGRHDLLRALHVDIAADLARRPTPSFRILHLGDLVDRGPDSAGVIDAVAAMVCDGDAGAVLGNHDRYMLDFLDGAPIGAQWLDCGGADTVRSYGLDPSMAHRSLARLREDLRAAIPTAHLAFLRGMPLSERHGDYLFVHAGIRPGRPLNRQTEDDLTEIREPFLSHDGDLGCVVIHGHTPNEAVVARRNRVGIDTKAYDTGVLSCLVLEADRKALLRGDRLVCLPTP
jgi:serine/threonine protein phosphatase 1